MSRLLTAVVLVALTFSRLASAAESLQSGDFVAVIGDSITEQQMYSVFIEDYLLMCQPAANLRMMQFGWSGETATGYANRMANDTLRFKPTVATTCFGMNDGGYSPMTPDKAKRYRYAQTSVVEQCKRAKVRFIVVGSPGCVDADTFRNDPAQAAMYNQTLADERDIAREVAESQQVAFADVYSPMVDAMTKAKAKYGKRYHVGGGDGVHADQNGHLVMAYAFLKALGCSGEIGRITIHLKEDKAEASQGHKVVAMAKGIAEIESTRYPFCFFGDPKQPSSTSGIIEFLPFNQDLNRLLLVVDGLPSERCKVTWGNATKEFSKSDLGQGINLAADFLDNPFSPAFQKVDAEVRKQQGYETPMIKSLVHNLPSFKQLVPDEAEGLERIAANATRRDRALFDAAAAAVVPVRHKITVEAVR